MSPPIINQFLGEIWQIIQEQNGARLQEYLVIEPPLSPIYQKIVEELKQAYPNANSHTALENKCKSFMPEYQDGEGGGSRSSFISFLVKYFAFLRDLNVDNLLETHDMLKVLLNQCVLALSSFMGLTVLPTVISLSRTLARLAIGLDKQPDLIASLTQRKESTGGDEAEERVTLVESSANVIREAFKKCLSERSASASGIDPDGRPEGRRIGIYLTANLCLKLFFHCKKLRSAEQIFGNIYQQSPPLSLFPASQRVTFLYYLGRYHFTNGHYFRAQLALQSAYDQCHKRCSRQRRLILIYLTTANIILGRFPTDYLWQRPEASGLQGKFGPICNAIIKGDLCSFRQYLDIQNESAEWFLRKRILLQLSDNCEVLVWRSLARRTFMLSGSVGDAASRKAPTVALEHLLTLYSYLEKKALLAPEKKGFTNGNPTVMINGQRPELPNGYTDPDLAGVVSPEPPVLPTMDIIESVVASLIEQDLLHGFITHANPRFAITGARNASPLQVGFPRVWDVIKAKSDDEVPGWVTERKSAAAGLGGGFRPGMVVNLSGARPAGAAPG